MVFRQITPSTIVLPSTMGANQTAIGILPADTMANEVLAALFDDHFDAVFGYSYVRCGSRELAEEIASDVFADAVRTIVADQSAVLNKSWLFAVARRRLIDHWRRAERHRRRVERLLLTAEPSPRSSSTGGPLDAATIEDEQIIAALDSLPERQRMVLVLRYLDELSVSEVADAADLSYQATESLLARARRSFARSYDEGTRP